jgi:hemoglobin
MRASGQLLVAIGAGLLATGARLDAADDHSLSPAVQNRRVHAALYKVTLEGVELFNSGQRTAAYYHFKAAATSLAPFLNYRREVQEALHKALAEAEDEPDLATRARILGEAMVRASDKTLEPVIARIRLPEKGDPKPDTLWGRLGGEEGVTRIIDDFVEGALANRKINFTRDNAYLQNPEDVKKLKRHLIELTSALGKGPYKYRGRSMQEIHEKMRITDAEFDALRVELHLALSGNGVQAADVLFILAGYDSTRANIVKVNDKPTPVVKGQPGLKLPGPPSVLKDLGGEQGVTKMMDQLIDRLIEDKRVNFTRDGKYLNTPAEIAALKGQFVALAIAVCTGKDYKGRSMFDAHKGMGITDAEFNAFVEDLGTVLRRNEVKPATIILLKELVESKRKDIVEKPEKVGGPVKQAKPVQASGPADRPRADGSPGDILLAYFFPPLLFFLRIR